MAEIINLNKARKAKARADAKTEAAANRASHGQTKGERAQADAEKAHLNHVLDGARIERPDDEPA
jgi:hypothetical protein